VLWTGVMLYVKESHYPDTMERYGHGTPDDWVERNVYAKHSVLGLWLMGAINIALFGVIAGRHHPDRADRLDPVLGRRRDQRRRHFWGYRNWDVPSPDASRNISPWGAWIGGEELHNNHHAYPASAKFSLKWYEFDLGWMYIRGLESLGPRDGEEGRAEAAFLGSEAGCR
jgi:stearoyl-CoA desaturase (delta-9 desaturase)